MADDFDRIRRFLDNPATRALLGLASIAGFFLYAGKRFSTDAGRRSYVQEVRQAAARRREQDRWHERRDWRIRAKLEYFNGRGGELYRERALIRIGPAPPIPDAVYERLPARFRGWHFGARSPSANASIDVAWDMADRDGQLRLDFQDRRAWSFIFYADGNDLQQYEKADQDFEAAHLACRLLATPGSPFSTITFARPNASEIRERIWLEFVAEHPELAEEDWPW